MIGALVTILKLAILSNYAKRNGLCMLRFLHFLYKLVKILVTVGCCCVVSQYVN